MGRKEKEDKRFFFIVLNQFTSLGLFWKKYKRLKWELNNKVFGMINMNLWENLT